MEVSQSLTFEEAIAATQSLIERMAANNLDETEIQSSIASLVKTRNGARGFFVTYLTDDRTLADNPSAAVINALTTSPEIVGELLVTNIAMSAAMAITHRRNNDEPMAQKSATVTKRSQILTQLTNLDPVPEKIAKLRASAATGKGEYQDFLQRWQYDDEQRQAIVKALSQVIK